MDKLKIISCIINKLTQFYAFDGKRLSNTKMMKLLYLICLESSIKEDNTYREDNLFKYFNNFIACPNGPIEIDVYNYIDLIPGFVYKDGYFIYDNNIAVLKTIQNEYSEILPLIDSSFLKLKNVIPAIILRNDGKLINLTQMLPLWKESFVYSPNRIMNLSRGNIERDYNKFIKIFNKTIKIVNHEIMEKNWCYKITEKGHPHEGETLWSGRYCAIAAFIFMQNNGRWYVLANKRGKGTPDFQGMWNAPCGYLEANESAQEGCSREVYEETGLYIKSNRFKLVHVETEPELCNHGNVTLRHVAVLVDEDLDPNNNIEDPENISKLEGGEVDEVSEIKWIPVKDVDNYQWAFNHKEVIKELFNKYVG